ncbi:endonuclease/exonuclease/phosphatase family protein [Alistipes sp.]|uniref:endonuclease/exonuclease/phosphatase family protein n=1 Tax=Alistipes sp. TaxID=1872444 RepID=UPI003A866FA0
MAAEYYNGYGERRSEKRRRSWIVWLLDAVMTLLSAVVAVVLVLTYLVPYVNPSRVWFFPALGLAAPITYVAGVVLMLYWIIRWRWLRAGVMILIVVIGFFKVSLFWRPDIRRTYEDDSQNPDRGTFKVMTYNVRSFYGENGHSSVEDVLRLIEEQDPDIICLQEFNARLAARSEEFSLLEEKYESAGFGRTAAPDSVYEAPLAVLSKFRILRSGTVLTPASSVWADLMVGDDTVRVFNNHLRSTAINAADNDYITEHRFLSDTARETKIRSIVGRLRENSVLRAAQVDSIARVIDATRTRRIVCGDFNDTPMSYVYRTMARGLRDAFRTCGSGYSHTYRGFFNTLRIDYVLSGGLDPVTYETLMVDYSDHHPVVVRLKKSDDD